MSDPFFLALFWGSASSARFTGSAEAKFEPIEGLEVFELNHSAVGAAFKVSPSHDEGPLAADPSKGTLAVSSTMWSTTYDAESPYLVIGASEVDPKIDLTVESIYSVGKFRCPSTGTYRDSRVSARFALISVDESTTELSQWFPEWPRGTAVVDRISGGVTRIPFTPGEKSRIISVLRENRNKTVHQSPSEISLFFMINAILVMCLAGWFVWKYLIARKKKV